MNLSHKAETAYWERQEAVKSQSQPPGTELLSPARPRLLNFPKQHQGQNIIKSSNAQDNRMETTIGASLHLTGQNDEDGPLWLTTIRSMKSVSKEKV